MTTRQCVMYRILNCVANMCILICFNHMLRANSKLVNEHLVIVYR